jgi:hypothetical protein
VPASGQSGRRWACIKGSRIGEKNCNENGFISLAKQGSKGFGCNGLGDRVSIGPGERHLTGRPLSSGKAGETVLDEESENGSKTLKKGSELAKSA